MRVAAAVHAEAPGGPAEESDFSRAHPASAPPLHVVTRASGFSRGASRRVAAHVIAYTRLSSRHSNPHRGSPRGTRRDARRPTTVITRGYRVATRNGWPRHVEIEREKPLCRRRRRRRRAPITPTDAKPRRSITRTHARARDPHSSVARVELTARPSSRPTITPPRA